MNNTATQPRRTASTAATRDQIAARAYAIYIETGLQPGRSTQNWRQAERELGFQGRTWDTAPATRIKRPVVRTVAQTVVRAILGDPTAMWSGIRLNA
ncbi:MAG: DUF2934 domain-containing protein [Planctomycetes bacterium]|nr:DUF2934 domain-containing protein [Planctomycetota bacterium]